MAGTLDGGKAAANTNKRKYGKDFYIKLGAMGGRVNHPETRYFHVNREAARIAGAKGGSISRRGRK